MAQIINTNTMSLNAQRNLSTSGNSLATSIQRLSSGLRINSAKDDAAGLAISERFTTQIRGINQAARNANDGISLAQTAEGALGEIGNNLQRIRELAVQARNATNSDSDRQALNAEVQLLKAEIQRVAEQTNFNGTNLLDGSFTNQAFQIGADQGQTINISQIANANIKELGNWNQVDTSAKSTAVAPIGAGAGAAVPGTANLDLSGIADPTLGFTFEVGGAQVSVPVGAGRDAASLATAVADAINGAVPGLAAADGDDNVTLTNTGNAAVLIDTFSNGVNPQTVGPQTGGGTASFNAGSFTLTGAKGTATINFAPAGGAGQRASDLVKSINDQSYNTGVTASLDDTGKLVLASQGGDIQIAGGATLTEQTGLTAGDTADAVIGTAWVAGQPKSGFADLDITTATGADNALNAMDAALLSINSSRADLGAVQNRFSSTIANLTTSSENMSAARSRIRDVDYAQETAELTRAQILQQAGTAMLAQANQVPQNVLSLLQS